MSNGVTTLQQYLNGKVRNISVPDATVSGIIIDAGCSTIEVEQPEIHEVIDDETGETITEEVTVVTEVHVDKDTDVSLLPDRERELCLAWLYVWLSSSLSQSGGTTDEDADWKHTEGSERMSDALRSHYLRLANNIFDKYDLPFAGEERWGLVGHGFRNPRLYGRSRRT